jgi:hypothetical protein
MPRGEAINTYLGCTDRALKLRRMTRNGRAVTIAAQNRYSNIKALNKMFNPTINLMYLCLLPW